MAKTATSDPKRFVALETMPRVKRGIPARQAYREIHNNNGGGIVVEVSGKPAYYLPSIFLHRFISHVARSRGAPKAGKMPVGEYLDLYFSLNDRLARSFRAGLTKEHWEPVRIAQSKFQVSTDVTPYVTAADRDYEVFAVLRGGKQIGWFVNHESTHTPPPAWVCEVGHKNYDFDSGKCTADPLCGKPLKT